MATIQALCIGHLGCGLHRQHFNNRKTHLDMVVWKIATLAPGGSSADFNAGEGKKALCRTCCASGDPAALGWLLVIRCCDSSWSREFTPPVPSLAAPHSLIPDGARRAGEPRPFTPSPGVHTLSGEMPA